MSDRHEKKARFRALHGRASPPLVLYNVWDVGSACAVAMSGATAIATSIWAVAAAQGYGDGERLPLKALCALTGQIARAVDLPSSIDVEGGYAVAPDAAARHVVRIAEARAVGVNVEDRMIGGSGLHPVSLHYSSSGLPPSAQRSTPRVCPFSSTRAATCFSRRKRPKGTPRCSPRRSPEAGHTPRRVRTAYSCRACSTRPSSSRPTRRCRRRSPSWRRPCRPTSPRWRPWASRASASAR